MCTNNKLGLIIFSSAAEKNFSKYYTGTPRKNLISGIKI